MLDLRQGTLSKISQDFAAEVTTQIDYYIRERDLFTSPESGTLEKGLYDQVFDLFKNEIVSMSLCTRIFKFVKQFCNRTIAINAAAGVQMDLSLYVNTYPFNLQPDELTDLHTTVSAMFDHELDVEVVSHDPKQLTFQTAERDFIAVVMYDVVDWFNSQEQSWRSGAKLKTCAIYVPRRFLTEPDEQALKEFERRDIDPFDFVQHTYINYVDLNFLPMSFFCVDLPSNPENLTDSVETSVKN